LPPLFRSLILPAMSIHGNIRLLRAGAFLVASLGLIAQPARPQSASGGPDQREVLEQILTQAYQPSQVGRGMMGIGSDTAIRRAGTIVVVQRPGLYGSFSRNEIASSAIHGLDASLYRGNKDYEVPAGERFYVFNVSVVQDNVTIALLSARIVNGAKGAGRIWTALTFYFPAQTLANADKDDVFRGITPWLAPEGLATISTLAPVAAAPTPAAAQPAPAGSAAPPVPAAPQPVAPPPAAERPASPAAQLAPGMTREEIVAALGPPQREMSFEGRSWLTYSNMVLVLEGGKLKSIDQSAPAPARVAVHSNPGGAEIYLDGQLIGSTPSTVEMPAGTHEVSVKLSGYQDWTRNLRVLSGSEINLGANLEKK
jgi:hypothetical protein